MTDAQRINQTSGAVEYYTPAHIIEAARSVMGVINLDPASCAEANETVRAEHYFTRRDNGLYQRWHGNVWLNHPFGRGTNERWMHKIRVERAFHRFNQLICITFASTSEKWFQYLLRFPQCFITPRLNYRLPGERETDSVPKGSVVTYIPGTVNNAHLFAEVFHYFGVVK